MLITLNPIESNLNRVQHLPECEKSHNSKCDQKLDHQNGVHLKESKSEFKKQAICVVLYWWVLVRH